MSELKDETIFLSDDKVFYTVEGEGEFVGQPSVFMRMSMCNLTCIGFKSEDAYKEHLFNGAILKLTGGEPLIQQAKLLKFIDYLKQEWGFVPRIDFETNATIYPSDRWVDDFQATFTTSPKLKSNGDPKGKRYIEEVLDWHTMHNSGFKFVIQSRRDMDEIMTEYVDKFDIPTGRVWLMPCAGSREEHIRVAADVAEIAKEYHFNFSPRLHLLLWDMALKV
jgi:organic radical activating enzyme